MSNWCRRRSWFVVISVGVPPHRHGLPERHPPVVRQTLFHVHLVANVEMGDVGGVDLGPLKLVLVTHVDPGLAIIGKCCQ